MKKQLWGLLLLFAGVCLQAQTVVKIPFLQPEIFSVSPGDVFVSLQANETKEIGSEIEISGGSGNYAFLWTRNGQELGTSPVLTVTEGGTYHLLVTDGNGCSATVTYFVDAHLSLQLLQADSAATPDAIALYQLNGKLLRVYKFPKESDSIDWQDFPKGYYLLSIQSGKKQVTKLIKIK
jgi:hypothetical protein